MEQTVQAQLDSRHKRSQWQGPLGGPSHLSPQSPIGLLPIAGLPKTDGASSPWNDAILESAAIIQPQVINTCAQFFSMFLAEHVCLEIGNLARN